MKGHFSDRVARIKINYTPGAVTEPLPCRKAEKISFNIATPVSFAVKSTSILMFAAPKALLKVKMKLQNTIRPVIASTNTAQSNLVASASPENITTYHHSSEGGTSDDPHYWRSFLIWALVFLLSVLIIAATIGNNDGTITGVFILVGLIAGIATIVYLVLWIASLSHD